jgi:hypothetical protein
MCFARYDASTLSIFASPPGDGTRHLRGAAVSGKAHNVSEKSYLNNRPKGGLKIKCVTVSLTMTNVSM